VFQYLTSIRPGSFRSSFLSLTGLAVLTFFVLSFAQRAHSAVAIVAWDQEVWVTGYKVYWGVSSRNYSYTVDARNNSVSTITNLPSTTYFIAATAYDNDGNESGFSDELVIDATTASAGAGGTVSPSGSFFQTRGDTQTFIITPTLGYQVSSVLGDEVSVGAVTSYTLSNINFSHGISAGFSPQVGITFCTDFRA